MGNKDGISTVGKLIIGGVIALITLLPGYFTGRKRSSNDQEA